MILLLLGIRILEYRESKNNMRTCPIEVKLKWGLLFFSAHIMLWLKRLRKQCGNSRAHFSAQIRFPWHVVFGRNLLLRPLLGFEIVRINCRKKTQVYSGSFKGYLSLEKTQFLEIRNFGLPDCCWIIRQQSKHSFDWDETQVLAGGSK